jgi:hypothetical protein
VARGPAAGDRYLEAAVEIALILDTLRRKGGVPQSEIPKAERASWEKAVALGFVRKVKSGGRFWWYQLTEEAHQG